MLYTVFVSLVIKNTSDLRELIENLARDVIFVSCLASTLWALQKTLQLELKFKNSLSI